MTWLWIALALLAIAALVVLGSLFLIVALAHLRFAAWSARERRDQVVRGALPPLSTWIGEVRAMLTLGAWMVTGLGDGGFSARQTKNRGRPVVCVHGILGSPSNMRGIRRALEQSGRPSYAVDLGRPLRPIEAYAPPLALALHQALALHPEGDGVDVVCHSMGGVVLRVVLAGDPELARAVRTVVTLASPHRGTALAVGMPGPEARALAWASQWMEKTPSLAVLAPQARIVTFAPRLDYVVYPLETCSVEGGECREVPDAGHTAILTRADVIRAVVDAVVAEGVAPSARAV